MEIFILEEKINKQWKALKKYGFEENRGQFHNEIRYVFKGQNNIVYFYINKIVIEVVSAKSSDKYEKIERKYKNILYYFDL